MTPMLADVPLRPQLVIVLLVMCQIALVSGQVFLKHAMNLTNLTPKPAARAWRMFAAGIGSLTLWFFIWMGVLQDTPLNKAFPFEGLSPVLICLAAWLFLRERMGPVGWLGLGLITTGITLVVMN